MQNVVRSLSPIEYWCFVALATENKLAVGHKGGKVDDKQVIPGLSTMSALLKASVSTHGMKQAGEALSQQPKRLRSQTSPSWSFSWMYERRMPSRPSAVFPVAGAAPS